MTIAPPLLLAISSMATCSKACSSLRRCSPILAFRSRTTCGVTGLLTGSVPLAVGHPVHRFSVTVAICSRHSERHHPAARHNSPALLPRRASRDSLNLSREPHGSITRGSTCSGSAWDGLPRRPGGDACLPRTRGSCRRRTSIANRLRPPGCAWRSGPGTSGHAR